MLVETGAAMAGASSTVESPHLVRVVAWLVAATVLFGVVIGYAVPGSRTTVLMLTVGVPSLGATVGAVVASERRGGELTERIVRSAAWASTAALAATAGYLVVSLVLLFLVLGGL